MIERERPLALGSVQALPVPGRCDIGGRELELHSAQGHTGDGMAVLIGWAGVLVAGDYCHPRRFRRWGRAAARRSTSPRWIGLRPLLERVEHVVPGHGPLLDRERAQRVLEQDTAYLGALIEHGPAAALPDGRRSPAQRRLHEANVERL